jgi:hypothetical protein
MWGNKASRHRLKLLLVGVATLLVAACADDFSWPWDRPAPWSAGTARSAPGQWENPTKPFEEWGRDRAECGELATMRAEEELAAASGGAPPVGWSRMAPFEQSMTQFEAGQRRDELFARCMSDRGYRLVRRASPSGD